MRARAAPTIVVTCEHAAADVPAVLGGLGLPRAVLASHRAFDVGAIEVARVLASTLGAPLHAGRWSRLVADLNRSEDHPKVVAARVDGRPVPANRLTAAQRRRRLEQYWVPYRERAQRDIAARCRRGPVLHLSVHSFVERLHGVERTNDVGLLHDPARPREVAVCTALKNELAAAGLRVRRNFPYFGDTDGFTSHLRAVLPADRYIGIEIECNQRWMRRAARRDRLAALLCAALRSVG